MPPRKPPTEPPKPPARGKPTLTVVRGTSKSAPKKPRVNQHVPTPEQRQIVMMAAAIGIPHDRICKLVGITSVTTLKKHYAEELEMGSDRATLKVAGTLFKIATDPGHPRAATAGIFWMKAKAGWTDRGDAADDDDDEGGDGVEVVRINIGGAKVGKS